MEAVHGAEVNPVSCLVQVAAAVRQAALGAGKFAAVFQFCSEQAAHWQERIGG